MFPSIILSLNSPQERPLMFEINGCNRGCPVKWTPGYKIVKNVISENVRFTKKVQMSDFNVTN